VVTALKGCEIRATVPERLPSLRDETLADPAELMPDE